MNWRTKWETEASSLITMAVISFLNAGFTLFLSSAQTTPISTIVLKAGLCLLQWITITFMARDTLIWGTFDYLD